jgi:hypothetical protein
MSLVTNILALAARAGNEAKALRTLINGNVADLSSLITTNRGTLVGAINEIASSSAPATTTAVVDFGTGKSNDSVEIVYAGATLTQTVRAWPLPWPDADTAVLDPMAVTGHVSTPGVVQLILSANRGNLVGLRKVAFQLIG